MSNDRYLIVSYSICAALSVGIGALVFVFLKRPFTVLVEATSGKRLSTILKRLFPAGLLLPALLGFLSVSYQSCSRMTYPEIVEDRSYLIAKNQEQISSILLSLIVAIFVWDLVVIFLAKLGPRKNPS